MYCYCLYCKTEKCKYVARAMEIVFGCRAVLPTQIQHIRRKGEMLDVERSLFPGYLFLYSEQARLDILKLRAVDGVIRCLNGSPEDYSLRGNDELFAQVLFQRGGVLGKTKVYRVGQRIYLNDEVFGGVEATIVKVDVRKGRMKVEFPFANTRLATWVEYEVTENRETEDPAAPPTDETA